MYNCMCVRCNEEFVGRYPKTKICKKCTKRGMPRGELHWNYKTGSYTYETIRGELRDEIRYCERCNKDLISVDGRFWAIHHKDHNHFNNDRLNLELLCRSCHQIEHDCVKNFEGATTISKESSVK